jgi:hypothetical protein
MPGYFLQVLSKTKPTAEFAKAMAEKNLASPELNARRPEKNNGIVAYFHENLAFCKRSLACKI